MRRTDDDRFLRRRQCLRARPARRGGGRGLPWRRVGGAAQGARFAHWEVRKSCLWEEEAEGGERARGNGSNSRKKERERRVEPEKVEPPPLRRLFLSSLTLSSPSFIFHSFFFFRSRSTFLFSSAVPLIRADSSLR